MDAQYVRVPAVGSSPGPRSEVATLLDVRGPAALAVHDQRQDDGQDAHDEADQAEGLDINHVLERVRVVLDHIQQQDQPDDEQKDADADSHGDSCCVSCNWRQPTTCPGSIRDTGPWARSWRG